MTAFSNGFEWDMWSPNWCRRCKNDINEDCPILLNVFVENEVPPEWSPGTNDLTDRYHCSEFEANDA